MSQRVSGVQGWVYYGGRKVLRMNNWNMNIVNIVEANSDFHSSGPRREHTGSKDFTGSISGQYELVDTSTGGTVDSPVINITQMSERGGTLAKGLAKFIETTKSMWSGNIVITDVSKNQPADAMQAITLNWAQADGPLRHTTSTSTST